MNSTERNPKIDVDVNRQVTSPIRKCSRRLHRTGVWSKRSTQVIKESITVRKKENGHIENGPWCISPIGDPYTPTKLQKTWWWSETPSWLMTRNITRFFTIQTGERNCFKCMVYNMYKKSVLTLCHTGAPRLAYWIDLLYLGSIPACLCTLCYMFIFITKSSEDVIHF